MNIEELQTKLISSGLGKYFERFRPIIRNSIRLQQIESDEKDIKIGQSKIGGKPDLPDNFLWVTETNLVETIEIKYLIFKNKKTEEITKPLSFIAQINLSETNEFDKENLLPKNGMLYFFYSSDQEVWGFDYKDKNKFKVIFWDGDFTMLKRTEIPINLPRHAVFKSNSINFKSEVSLPSYGNELYNDFEDEEEEIFLDEIFNEETVTKMLGYSDNIQDEMELECELVTNGIYCGDPSGYNNPKAKELEPSAKDWRLLLQIDSSDETEMMWGDCGRLYFWIKKDDLKDKNFDKCWFSLQCS